MFPLTSNQCIENREEAIHAEIQSGHHAGRHKHQARPVQPGYGTFGSDADPDRSGGGSEPPDGLPVP